MVFLKHKVARNRVKKLFNHQTQIIKVVSYDIWNSKPRLAKNWSPEAAFRTGLIHTIGTKHQTCTVHTQGTKTRTSQFTLKLHNFNPKHSAFLITRYRTINMHQVWDLSKAQSRYFIKICIIRHTTMKGHIT